VTIRQCVDHPDKVVAQGCQAGQLGVKLGDPALQQPLGGFARTDSGIADLEEFGDLAQAETEPLTTLDEADPFDRITWVHPVTRWRSWRGREQASAFVVADGVRADADRSRQLGDP
jgi:hypothetical protein